MFIYSCVISTVHNCAFISVLVCFLNILYNMWIVWLSNMFAAIAFLKVCFLNWFFSVVILDMMVMLNVIFSCWYCYRYCCKTLLYALCIKLLHNMILIICSCVFYFCAIDLMNMYAVFKERLNCLNNSPTDASGVLCCLLYWAIFYDNKLPFS